MGHWTRDGLCKVEDVVANVARNYVTQQQEQFAMISPPGES
jgi:hypothetical protein